MNTWKGALGVLGAGLISGAVLAGCSSGGGTPGQSPVAHPTATATPGLSAAQKEFVSSMRTIFSFQSSVSNGVITTFGEEVCSNASNGQSIATQVPSVQKYWTNTTVGNSIQMVVLAENDLCPTDSAPQTVTYVVSGSNASVTYGPSGTDDSGSVPMSVSQPLSDPSYYSISAQLNGAGAVTCNLEVDGVSISTASASGGYNIASCEIDQDPLTNSWENTNDG